MVLALLIGFYLLVERPERQWYDGRAAAESVKTLTWRYAVGGADFTADKPMSEADRDFLDRLRAITQGLRHIRVTGASGSEITERMREMRQASFEERRAAYLTGRVADQRKWYSAAASRHNKRALGWRITSLGAQFVGIVGGILMTAEVINFDLIGIAAAATAAALAWLQTREHATLAEAYAVTGRELALAEEQLKGAAEPEWPTVVDNTEQAVSREHTLWKARRTSLEA